MAALAPVRLPIILPMIYLLSPITGKWFDEFARGLDEAFALEAFFIGVLPCHGKAREYEVLAAKVCGQGFKRSDGIPKAARLVAHNEFFTEHLFCIRPPRFGYVVPYKARPCGDKREWPIAVECGCKPCLYGEQADLQPCSVGRAARCDAGQRREQALYEGVLRVLGVNELGQLPNPHE